MAKLSMEDIRYWLSEIKSCEARQQKELMARNYYPALIRYYEGEMQADVNKTPTAQDSVKKLAVINEYFPNTNNLIAEVMYQNPDIITEATRPTAPPIFPGMPQVPVEENEPIMKGALTYGFKKLEALIENRLALFDMIYAGYCGVEVNYLVERPPTKPEKGTKPTFTQRVRDMMKPEEDLEREQPPKEQSESKEETYIHRWNPLNILLDYRAERIKELRYIVKKIRYSHAEFKVKYPAFENMVTATEVIPYTENHEDTHRKAIVVYEIQKKGKDTYTTICITPSLRTQELDYYERLYTTNGFNIKIGTLHKYGKLYPISYAKVNKSLQDDINNYVTHMMEVAERNNPKIGYNSEHVKADGLKSLKSTKVNDTVNCGPKGNPNSVWPIPHTNVSIENKELLALFQQHKEKMWSVSEARTSGKAIKPKFATELEIQEAGFLARQADMQDGLRMLLRQELDTLKDIIVTFWDDEHWFKITGGPKPTWYIPDMRVTPSGEKIIINPLTDILTKDYEVDVDISSALRPNKERERKEKIDYLTWLIQQALPTVLMPQGKMISIEQIENTARDFGYNPKSLIVDMPPEMIQAMAQPQVTRK